MCCLSVCSRCFCTWEITAARSRCSITNRRNSAAEIDHIAQLNRGNEVATSAERRSVSVFLSSVRCSFGDSLHAPETTRLRRDLSAASFVIALLPSLLDSPNGQDLCPHSPFRDRHLHSRTILSDAVKARTLCRPLFPGVSNRIYRPNTLTSGARPLAQVLDPPR